MDKQGESNNKDIKKLAEEQKKERELTKRKDKIYPETITPLRKKLPPLTRINLIGWLYKIGYTERKISRVLSVSLRTVVRYMGKGRKRVDPGGKVVKNGGTHGHTGEKKGSEG